MNLGSGSAGELTFLDIVALMSFFVALENLDMNLTQTDKQELQQDLANKTDLLLEEVHRHLEAQDIKIDRMLSILEENYANNQKDGRPNR